MFAHSINSETISMNRKNMIKKSVRMFKEKPSMRFWISALALRYSS